MRYKVKKGPTDTEQNVSSSLFLVLSSLAFLSKSHRVEVSQTTLTNNLLTIKTLK